MISRYFISINFAVLITFGLFFGMQMLIKGDGQIKLDKSERFKVTLDHVRPIEERNDEIVPPELDEIVEPPKAPKLKTTISDDGVTINAPDLKVKPHTPKVTDTGSGFNGGEGDYLPIVKVAPQYPARMLEQGIEGYVKVQFTVTTTGTTSNAVAISSSHKAFEKSALKAVEKFKYKPRIVDGEAVSVTGVTNTIEFKLEK